MLDDRRFDIVVFGATGFTGGLVAEYLAAQPHALRWALAGRDGAKLERVRDRLPLREGQQPAIVVADAGDDTALRALAQDARVVLTTVGPYVKYGEPLLRACAETGTHYVDLTGEPAFRDLSLARYHTRAQANRAKIVHSCGFDSIPHDLGAYFTLQALRRRMSATERASAAIRIEGFVRVRGEFSGGTWYSMLESMVKPAPDPNRGAGVQPVDAAIEGRDGRKRGLLPAVVHYRKEHGLWAVPGDTIDPAIVLHSAQLLREYGPDFRYGYHLGLNSRLEVAALRLGFALLGFLAQFAAMRRLLGKIRKPGEGPSAAAREKAWFRVLFAARSPTQQVLCEVRGGDPFYNETAKMISEAALSLAFDQERLPAHYGVVSTAAGIGQVLIERLMRAGITFEEKGADTAEASEPQPAHHGPTAA